MQFETFILLLYKEKYTECRNNSKNTLIGLDKISRYFGGL